MSHTHTIQLELVEAAKRGELTGPQRELLNMGQTYSPSSHRRVIMSRRADQSPLRSSSSIKQVIFQVI